MKSRLLLSIPVLMLIAMPAAAQSGEPAIACTAGDYVEVMEVDGSNPTRVFQIQKFGLQPDAPSWAPDTPATLRPALWKI